MALALAALVFTGCGAGPGPEAAWTAEGGHMGRGCRYVDDPAAMPSFSELTRVGARGNLALWGRDMGPADSVVLSVRYAYDARLEWVRAISSTVGPERVRALERLVLGALDETGHEDWGLRLRIVAGEVEEVAPSVICDPEQATGSPIWARVPTGAGALQDFYLVRGRRVHVRVTLDDRGRIVDVRLVRSTYSRWVDQYVVDYVRSLSFDPRLHDGFGVATTFEVELRFPRR